MVLAAPFSAVMSDGSTDSAVLEQEIIYCRFAKDGNVNVRFLSIEELERGTAVNITAAIFGALDAVDPGWAPKLVALGADGAAVMQGHKRGVVALLKAKCPWLMVG